MRILVISDSHGQYGVLRELLKKEKYDVIYHCGDLEGGEDIIPGLAGCNMVAVKGNCDYTYSLPSETVLKVGNHKIFMTHGHGYRVKYDLLRLRLAAEAAGCDFALFGHTHMPVLTCEGGVTIMNPGSISYPRQDGKAYTYGILEVDKNGYITPQIKAFAD